MSSWDKNKMKTIQIPKNDFSHKKLSPKILEKSSDFKNENIISWTKIVEHYPWFVSENKLNHP